MGCLTAQEMGRIIRTRPELPPEQLANFLSLPVDVVNDACKILEEKGIDLNSPEDFSTLNGATIFMVIAYLGMHYMPLPRLEESTEVSMGYYPYRLRVLTNRQGLSVSLYLTHYQEKALTSRMNTAFPPLDSTQTSDTMEL